MRLLISTGLTLAFCLSFSALHAEEAPPLPVAISPQDPAIHYSGRFDTNAKDGPRCAWSASGVSIRFTGTDINVRLKENGQDRWQVEVDGKPATTLQLERGEHSYCAAAGLPAGDHTLTLIKATEAFVGITQILGFELNEGGKLQPFAAPERRIEVIGDSISCGYGNEAPNQNVHFSPKTENAYFTYGAITARAVHADYACIAWSGRKMWPDNTIPEIYDLTIPIEPGGKWAFSTPPPQAVLINLSTNDFGKGNPDEAKWTGTYKEFITRVRTHYPDCTIYCATSPMMGDWDARKPRTTVRRYLEEIVNSLTTAGDHKIHLIEFAVQDQKDGIGADWHPSIKTQEVMAAVFEEALRRDLNW